MPQRHAIYYAPAADDPLWLAATEWIGRDPLADGPAPPETVAGVDRAMITDNSVSARRYGFHATIKAPMALAEGTDEAGFDAALRQFAATHAPVTIGRLKPTLIGRFLALTPVVQTEALTAFAGEVVEAFDGFRKPMGAAERERRIASGGLSARQVELLDRYGYPYVFEQFRFHMTLTDQLGDGLAEKLGAAAERHFAEALARDIVLDRLVVFSEAEAGAAFTRGADYRLEGSEG